MYKFLEEQSNQRLKNWYQFRQQLESSSTPLDDVAEYFSKVPRVKIYTDPYDQSTFVDDKVYGLVEDEWILAKTLPKTLNYLKIYNMPPLH